MRPMCMKYKEIHMSMIISAHLHVGSQAFGLEASPQAPPGFSVPGRRLLP